MSILALSSDFARAEKLDDQARLILPKVSQFSAKVPELKVQSENLEIAYLPKNPSHPFVALLRGNFKSENWTILMNGSRLPLDTDGEFNVSIPIIGKTSVIDLVAVGSYGEIIREKRIVYFKDWNENYLASFLNQKKSRSNFRFSPSLGITSVTYQGTLLPTFSQVALTGKMALQFPLGPKWDLGFNAFYTLLPLSSNNPDVTVRYLGANARIGRTFGLGKSSWIFSLMGGVYYATMFVTPSEFGFENILGPQLFPGLRKKLSAGDSIFVYFKYSPIMNQLSVLDLNNREMAVGVSYSYPVKDGNSLSIMLDYSNIILMNLDSKSDSTSTTLSIGYQF
jgi:hypothetical protein